MKLLGREISVIAKGINQLWMKRGHILNWTSSAEACVAALQTQRPKVTSKGGLKLKLSN